MGSPSLDDVSPGGLAGAIRKGLQLDPLTSPIARVAEALVGGGGTTVRKPEPSAQPTEAKPTPPADTSSSGFRRLPSSSDVSESGFRRLPPAQKPWVNDAGQVVYPPGTKAPPTGQSGGSGLLGLWDRLSKEGPAALIKPPPEEKEYTAQNFPLRYENGKLGFALPELLATPLRGAVEGGRDIAGRGAPYGSDISPDVKAAVGAFASPLRFGMPDQSRELVKQGMGLTRPPPGLLDQQARVEQARQRVSSAFETGAQGGGPTALDTMTEMHRARAAGQPLALIDVPNQAMQSMASKIYRRGETGASQIRSFLEKRDLESLGRSERLINVGISDRPLSLTAERLAEQRSAAAQPVWAEVRRGGSTAPLAQQFETAFQESLKAKTEALKAVEQARSLAMQARARQTTAGNVYARSGANEAFRNAETGLKDAMDHLDRVSQESLEIQGRLKRAIADKTANAPGAIWSPRLQEFLDQPEIKQGIRRGWNMERRNAVGRGEPFKPSEYAITGIDAKGDPIVGEVPNMALLQVAKEGLDAILESKSMRDQFGRINKNGRSYVALRDGLVKELDRLNPAYKAARDMWAGDTANMRALQDGRSLLSPGRFPQIEDAERHFAGLSESEKEFFKIGVATDLKNRLYRNRTINTEDIKRRLRPLFRNEQEGTDFIDALQRERTMRQTQSQIRGIPQHPDEGAAASEVALHAAHGLGNLLHGNFVRGAMNALRLRKLLANRPDPAIDIEIAKILTDPNLFVRGSEPPLIPRIGGPGPLGGTITHSSSIKLPPSTP